MSKQNTPKLTARERAQVLKAAEMVASDVECFSCVALNSVDLAVRFTDTFAGDAWRHPFWIMYLAPELSLGERRELRVLLLLLFREVYS